MPLCGESMTIGSAPCAGRGHADGRRRGLRCFGSWRLILRSPARGRHALHCAARRSPGARRRCPTPHAPCPRPALLCLGLLQPPLRAAPASVYLQELSSTEVRDALRAGQRTIIIPVGGTEQNGAHMALGKHNFRVQALAGRIAAELGNALVAPVVAYVPEGRISPPTEHMRYAGTISVPEDAFKAVLDGAARSLRAARLHRHRDHRRQRQLPGALKAVADALNRDWKGRPGARALHRRLLPGGAGSPSRKLLRERGLSDAQIGTPCRRRRHRADAGGGRARACGLRKCRRAQARRASAATRQRASAELGKLGTDLIVQRSVAAIRKATAAPR